jgi:hypothetical protein
VSAIKTGGKAGLFGNPAANPAEIPLAAKNR